jgi:hypothetical protein
MKAEVTGEAIPGGPVIKFIREVRLELVCRQRTRLAALPTKAFRQEEERHC